MSLKISSVMSIWCSVCLLLAGCTPSMRPAQPVFVTAPPQDAPAMLPTTQQKLAEMQDNKTCHQRDTGCLLIEVVGMPGDIPLNHVFISITVPMGLAAKTNERGWASQHLVEIGQYEASMSLSQAQDVVVHRDRQKIVIQSGQPEFVRFEVPIEKVPNYYLPADDT